MIIIILPQLWMSKQNQNNSLLFTNTWRPTSDVTFMVDSTDTDIKESAGSCVLHRVPYTHPDPLHLITATISWHMESDSRFCNTRVGEHPTLLLVSIVRRWGDDSSIILRLRCGGWDSRHIGRSTFQSYKYRMDYAHMTQQARKLLG